MNKPKIEPYSPTISEIEQFVFDAGSDHVPTFGGTYGGIYCQQISDEIAPCIFAILESQLKINAYLEIGVAAGGTTFLINHFLKPDRIVLIDNNQHPKHHMRSYVLRDISYNEIIGDSHAGSTVAVLKTFETKFDIILVDGDHTYDGVSKDIKIYQKYLRVNGFLIFHDSIIPELGVMQAVSDLKKSNDMEFINNYITQKHSKPCGVALFRKADK